MTNGIPRIFRSHRGYVAMSTAVLGVAIGVNLFVFTVVNALWLRPLPLPESSRVVTVPQDTFSLRPEDAVEGPTSPLFAVFGGGVAEQVDTGGWKGWFEALRPQIEIAGVTSDLETVGVTPRYFSVLGLSIRGRDFTAEDERIGAEPVAIISDRLWAVAFGHRSDVIGAVVPATPVSIRVIGVAPPHFEGARRGERIDLWIPTNLVRRLAPREWAEEPIPSFLVARLGAGETAAGATKRYREVASAAFQNAGRVYKPAVLPTVVPLSEIYGTPESPTLVINERGPFVVVSALALLVLLGGCATIAALVLIHYERRRAELALKMSLGAGRRRLVTELMRDLSWIAVTGTIGGLLVAMLGTRVVPALSLPGGVNLGRLDLSIDWRVCVVAITVTVLTLALAAAVPIGRATRHGFAVELLGGMSITSLGSLRVRQFLLGFQVCATIVVLIAAGLFVRAVAQAFGSAAGFDVNRTVFVSIQEASPHAQPAGDRTALLAERSARLIGTLRELPAVTEVAESISPISIDAAASIVRPKMLEVDDREYEAFVGVMRGSPNLLSTLGVPIVAGRSLKAADAIGNESFAAPHPAVITQSLARRFSPYGGALGHSLSIPRVGQLLIVGIARDFAYGSLTRPADGVAVIAGPGTSSIVSSFIIRTERPEMVAGLVRRTMKGEVVRVATAAEVIARDIGRERLGAWFFSGFGLATLLLGVGGAFGLVAYLAESQRREFGVRMALGARVSDLIRSALAAALAPVSAGVAAGLILGSVISRVFVAFLVGISSLDVLTYMTVAVLMLGCTATAALAAAWRLRDTTPADALRAT
jgi:predicted permease